MANEKFKIHEAALEILRENSLMTMAEAVESAKRTVKLQEQLEELTKHAKFLSQEFLLLNSLLDQLDNFLDQERHPDGPR